MMRCWQNDPDARPTFKDLKNQLKDMETLHKVRFVMNMTIYDFILTFFCLNQMFSCSPK